MNLLTWLVRLCGGCRHHDCYRERRLLHDVPVLHFVCADCGHAVPAVERTADEHRAIVRAGEIKRLVVRQAAHIHEVRRMSGLRRYAAR